MRRSVFLDHSNATKNTDNSYSYDFKRYHDRNFKGFEIKSAVAMYEPALVVNVQTSDILAMSSLLSFIDFHDKTTITPSSITEGTAITGVDGKGSQNMQLDDGTNECNYTEYGNLKGFKSNGNGKFLGDETAPQPAAQTNDMCSTFLFRTKQTAGSPYYLFRTRVMRFRCNNSGNKLEIVADSTVVNTGLTFIDSVTTMYMLQARWNGTTHVMEVELLDLALNTSQTATVTGLTDNLEPDPTFGFYLGHDSLTGNKNVWYGNYVSITSTAAADCLKVKNYMKSLYSGEPVSTPIDTPHSLKLHSAALSTQRVGKAIQKVDGHGSTAIDTLLYKQTIDSKGIFSSVDGKKFITDNTQLDKVDVEFRDPQDNVVDVSDFCVTLDVFNNIAQL